MAAIGDNQIPILAIQRPKYELIPEAIPGMLVGYARVSTEDQRLDLQRDALLEGGCDPAHIYEEQISSTRSARPQLQACLKALRPGDVLVVWRLDRLGRSLSELITITEALDARGIGLRSLTEHIDTTTAGGRLIFHVMGAIAQFERDLIAERTRAGLKAARLRGHKGGRPRKITDAKWRIAKPLMDDGRIAYGDIAKTIGVSRSAPYRERSRREQEAVAKVAKAKK